MSGMTPSQSILILDFGSQYTQLLARRVREIGVYSEIWPWNISEARVRAFNPCGIILSGGPYSTTAEKSPQAAAYLFEIKIPILGICYGMQSMALQLGGQVQATGQREFGYAQAVIQQPGSLLQDIADGVDPDGHSLLEIWMSHEDQVTTLPPGFIGLAATATCGCVAMADEQRKLYGVQFHPEVTQTLQGQQILTHFVREICGCAVLWTPNTILEQSITAVRNQVGGDQVLLALSGGVDSAVTASLLQRSIGQQLTCIFIDNGLLRLNEREQVSKMFQEYFGLKVLVIEAEERFLTALQGITDPEEKRQIIGRLFIQLFEEQGGQFSQIKWLAQGTIYTDVIESAVDKSNPAVVIKSHHNVGGLPQHLKWPLLEPLRMLFKDEVRQIGLQLGLPYDLLYRHPFPGPGLAVRIVGEVKKVYCDLLRHVDAVFIQALQEEKLYYTVSQAFAVFLPVRSVGVVGDRRQYEWVIALRAIESVDFMTARWAHLPYAFLEKVTNRIINEIPGISRVVYDITGKPPATIEWE